MADYQVLIAVVVQVGDDESSADVGLFEIGSRFAAQEFKSAV